MNFIPRSDTSPEGEEVDRGGTAGRGRVVGRARAVVDPAPGGLNESTWLAGQMALAGALAGWRAQADVAPVLAALARFGQGEPIETLPVLAGLFELGNPNATGLVSGLFERGLLGLAAYPEAQVPLRHDPERTRETLELARSGTASLSLTLCEAGAMAHTPEPFGVRFASVERWMKVLAGSAMGEHVLRSEPEPGESGGHLESGNVALSLGSVHYQWGPREALLVRLVRADLVVLRLERAIEDAGHPCRVPSETDAQREIATAALAAMQRRDAVPVLSRLATGSDAADLRWQALRSVLGIDTRAGMVLLAELAGSGEEPLSQAARALQGELLERHPELGRVAQWQG